MFVRLALESDTEAIVELARLAHEESQPYHAYDADRVRELVQRYLETANPTFWVVDDRRDVIGLLMATLSNYWSAAGFYATQEVIFVRPDRRGTRAAVILVATLVAWADRLGAKEITGGNDNGLDAKALRRVLEHFGFEEVGRFMRRPHGQKGQLRHHGRRSGADGRAGAAAACP